jgi:beta-lactamase family protein
VPGVRAISVATCAAAVLLVSGATGAVATAGVARAGKTVPFWHSVSRYIGGRSGRISVAVYDLRSGTTRVYRSGREYDAASTVKVQILGTVLHLAQQQQRWLTPEEQSEAAPMIEDSDNDDATALWNDVGGAPGVQQFDDLVPMSHTTANAYWGLTKVTAPDAVRLLRRFVVRSSLLNNRARAYGLGLMKHVTQSQRWGVTGGVPSRVTVALKNGWLRSPDTSWIVHSMGWVHGRRHDYVIAVLTDGNVSESYGIATIEGISARVWARL